MTVNKRKREFIESKKKILRLYLYINGDVTAVCPSRQGTELRIGMPSETSSNIHNYSISSFGPQ